MLKTGIQLLNNYSSLVQKASPLKFGIDYKYLDPDDYSDQFQIYDKKYTDLQLAA